MTDRPGRFPSGKLWKKVTSWTTAKLFTSYEFGLGISDELNGFPTETSEHLSFQRTEMSSGVIVGVGVVVVLGGDLGCGCATPLLT